MEGQTTEQVALPEEQPGAVGQGLSSDDIADASNFIEDAETAAVWRMNPDKVVPYEMLEKENWANRVSAWADTWASVCLTNHADLPSS